MARKNFIFIFQTVWIWLLVLSALMLLASCNQGTPSSPPSLFLVIRDPGCGGLGQCPGSTIMINTDGSGKKCNFNDPQCQKPNHIFPPHTFNIDTTHQLLSQIGSVHNIPGHFCVLPGGNPGPTIVYNGQESGDFTCITSTDPQTYQNLQKEVYMFINQAAPF